MIFFHHAYTMLLCYFAVLLRQWCSMPSSFQKVSSIYLTLKPTYLFLSVIICLGIAIEKTMRYAVQCRFSSEHLLWNFSRNSPSKYWRKSIPCLPLSYVIPLLEKNLNKYRLTLTIVWISQDYIMTNSSVKYMTQNKFWPSLFFLPLKKGVSFCFRKLTDLR